MLNRNHQNFSFLGPPKTQRLIRRPLLNEAIPNPIRSEDSTLDRTISSTSTSVSPSLYSTKSLLDILNFDNNSKFTETNLTPNSDDTLTVIPLNISTENKSNSEYECEYELSITKNAPKSELTTPLDSLFPSQTNLLNPSAQPPKENLDSILDEDSLPKSLELVVKFNPLLNIKFVPNEFYKNKTTFVNSKSSKKAKNNTAVTDNSPEINIQITISESEIDSKNEPKVATASNDSSKSVPKVNKENLNHENEYNSPSLLSRSSSSSSSSLFTNGTVKESTSPMLNQIFNLLDNSQYFPERTVSNQLSDNTYSPNKSKEEDDESKCVSAYEKIVRILDASLDERINKSLYDYYGDEYQITEESQLSYHKINDLNNSQSDIDYYFKPNISNYWFDSEPRKVKSIYDEIAHLLDNAHLLKMQKKQSFVNAFY